MSETTNIAWVTDLPTKPGRYFIRPILKGPGRTRSYPVIVSEFGGSLVAWAGPDLCEHFRMASVDRVHAFLDEPGLEWLYVDEVTEIAALYPDKPNEDLRVMEFPKGA